MNFAAMKETVSKLRDPLSRRRVVRILLRTLSVLVLLVFASSLAFGQGGVNLSGTWILDKSKSEMPKTAGKGGGIGSLMAGLDFGVKMVIEQQGATLKVTRIFEAIGQERSHTFTYSTDGKETTYTGPRGGSVISKASWEGDKLVITSTQKLKTRRGEGSMEKKEVWSLSSDGKTLTIDITSKTPKGEQTAKAVFNKQ